MNTFFPISKFVLATVTAAFLTFAWMTPHAMADDDDDHIDAARLHAAGAILSLEQILERARATHQGKVLETDLEYKRGKYIYEVEMLDDKGVVWEMKFDAASGEMLKNKQDD